jgi:hypothetical protein
LPLHPQHGALLLRSALGTVGLLVASASLLDAEYHERDHYAGNSDHRGDPGRPRRPRLRGAAVLPQHARIVLGVAGRRRPLP